MQSAAASSQLLFVDKSEFWHATMDFMPKFALETTQWPYYDDLVYQSVVWDREYSLVAGVTFDFTIEFGHMAYYKLSATLNFLQVGFGINDILFTESPMHYCSLYYLDSRLMEASVFFETNTKPCAEFRSKQVERMSWHWDSRDSQKTTYPSSTTSSMYPRREGEQ